MPSPRSLFVLTLLLMAGCAPTATPDPGTEPAAEPNAPATSAEGPEALAEARARWADAGLSAYRYQIEYACFCPPEAMGPFTVTVRGGVVEPSGQTAPPGGALPTVEDLFARIEGAFAEGADAVDVTYDAARGYPLSIYIDYEQLMADEEFRATLSGLEPLGN